MIRTKNWFITIGLILIMQNAYSQKSDYIATDSSMISGIKLINGTSSTNAKFIRMKKDGRVIRYSAEQLSGYGLKNGTVYESKIISIAGESKQVFLEKLEGGKIDLYYYTEEDINTFFLQPDSTVFREISKDNFRKVISEFTSDFAWKASQVQIVKYNRKSLSKLISLYNNDRDQPLPFTRIGIIAGVYSATLIKPSSLSIKQLNDISFTPSTSILLGVFGDLPLNMSEFSLNVGLNYSKSEFSAISRSTNSDVDVIINFTSLNMPFLLRYTIPTLIWRPFVNAGGIYSYHLRNESKIYESSIDQNIIKINEVQQERSLISESMLGYSVGIGVQYNLSFKKTAALEFRFNKLYGNESTLNKSYCEILTSFSF